MAQARYFVVHHDGNWLIKFDDEEYGPYNTQSEAMLFAIDAAQKLGDQGERKAEVCRCHRRREPSRVAGPGPIRERETVGETDLGGGDRRRDTCSSHDSHEPRGRHHTAACQASSRSGAPVHWLRGETRPS